MSAFSFKLRREPMTDEQYIERVRKGLQRSTQQRWWYLLVALFAIVAIMWFGNTMVYKLIQSTTPSHQRSVVYAVFAFAALGGLVISMWLSLLIQAVVLMFTEYRKDRLLIECWDALNQLLAERESHVEREQSNTAGAAGD